MNQIFKISLVCCLCATVSQAELIGYWTFDSDTCEDLSGNNYHGTMNGGSYSTDVPAVLGGGKSINLTGGNHYVIIDSIALGAADDPFNFNQSMTVSLWAKGWPDGQWEPFVSKRGENSRGWQVRRYSTTSQVGLTLRMTTTEDLAGQTTSASDGNWHHIAVSYNGYRQRIYVDGVLDRVNRATGTISDTVERVVFGAREYDTAGNVQYHSRVRLDDIAIYGDVLSESQIKILAEGGDPTAILDVVQPIGYWTFDDDDPTTNIVKDASGLGRDGTSYSGGKYTNDVPAVLAGGKSIDMRGTNAYVLIDSVLYNDPADPFRLGKDISVSVWVKGTTGTDWTPVFVAKHGESTWGWQVRRSGSSTRVNWTTRGAGGDFEGFLGVLNDGKWHHVACTYDGAYKKIYVDGFLDKQAATTGEVRDDCYEHVIFGARNNGGVPQGFADVQLDDISIFGQVLTKSQIQLLAQGTSPTNLPGLSSTSPQVYDFEDGTMQGWRNVLVSRLLRPGTDSVGSNYGQDYRADNKWGGERGQYKLEQGPQSTGAEDARHSSMLVRSPQFVLDGSGDLSMWLIGGVGPVNAYANESDNIGLTHSTLGTMRAYLRRASDGAYLLSLRKPVNGSTPLYVAWTAAELASFVGETCTVDVVDGNDGGWGWIAVDDIVIPGTLLPEPGLAAIQFDMCQQRGTYQGTGGPAHAVNRISANGKWWNGSGVDVAAGQLFWADGAPAESVSIDCGVSTNGISGADIAWSVSPAGSATDTGTGIYNNFLMKDWAYAAAHNDIGVRVAGLAPGIYQVFALVREPQEMARTYDVYFGIDIDSSADAGVKKTSIAATSATTWTRGENYVSAIMQVDSENDYLTIIVDGTNAEWSSIQGLQIVNITAVYVEGSLILLR